MELGNATLLIVVSVGDGTLTECTKSLVALRAARRYNYIFVVVRVEDTAGECSLPVPLSALLYG